MRDCHNREITYLRLSVTSRCTLRCGYCRGGAQEPAQDELTGDEFVRIARAFAGLGIEKIRLTGGEPLLREDILSLTERVAALDGITELAMTTNAQRLPGMAVALKRAGLKRINISVDSLLPARYRAMTGGGELAPVLRGVEEALAAGLLVKLNVVLLRGVNDGEVDSFIALTKDRPLDVRFIELMPMGERADIKLRVTTDELLLARPFLEPLPPRYPGQPASDYRAPGHMGRVGFISPISHKFCAGCNRIRVTSDGMLRPCLGVDSEIPLRPALAEPDDAALIAAITDAAFHKPQGHTFSQAGFRAKDMSRIGG